VLDADGLPNPSGDKLASEEGTEKGETPKENCCLEEKDGLSER